MFIERLGAKAKSISTSFLMTLPTTWQFLLSHTVRVICACVGDTVNPKMNGSTAFWKCWMPSGTRKIGILFTTELGKWTSRMPSRRQNTPPCQLKRIKSLVNIYYMLKQRHAGWVDYILMLLFTNIVCYYYCLFSQLYGAWLQESFQFKLVE